MNPLRLLVLLVSLPLLLGGCEKFTVEPVAVQKAIEGVNAEEVEEREDIVYLKGSDTPYTGKVFRFHENGQMARETSWKEGKQDGLGVTWHENGQKKSEVNYKDGKFEGLMVGWHENGQKNGEVNWKNGKKDGLALHWHESGQKKGEANYKDDKRDGLVVEWHENGQKLFEGNFKDGEEVEGSVKYWNSKGEPEE